MRIGNTLSVYVLAGSLVFLGMTISGSQASAAPEYVKKSDFMQLQKDFTYFKFCVNQNFWKISKYDAEHNDPSYFTQKCK